jgi:hypothetical protein
LHFLRAHPAADRGQAVLDLHRLDSTDHIAFAKRRDELGYQHAHRAALDAVRTRALQTTLGLLPGKV